MIRGHTVSGSRCVRFACVAVTETTLSPLAFDVRTLVGLQGSQCSPAQAICQKASS